MPHFDVLHCVNDAPFMEQLEALLPAYLAERRWFAGKTGQQSSVKIETAVALNANTEYAFLLLLTKRPGSIAQRYLLPVTLKPDANDTTGFIMRVALSSPPVILIDAFFDDDFIRLLLRGMATAAEGPTALGPGLHFRRYEDFQSERALDSRAKLVRPQVEQSNTSIVTEIGILKCFRRIESGLHPEIEIGQTLSKQNFGHTPELLGSLELIDDSGQSTALCVLQRFIPDGIDGWRFVETSLDIVLSTAGEREGIEVLLATLGNLGEITAELHNVLAHTTIPGFRAEPVSSTWLLEWRSKVSASLEEMFALLERQSWERSTQTQVDRILNGRLSLVAKIGSLVPTHADLERTRIHGDLHLGQTIIAHNEIYIVDFEGEPMKPLAARREKHLPLRDVAGVLRSIEYAIAIKIRSCSSTDHRTLLETLAGEMKSRFLQQYSATYYKALDPNSLELSVIEKCVYEVVYEAENRPDWIEIPIAGLLSVLSDESVIN